MVGLVKHVVDRIQFDQIATGSGSVVILTGKGPPSTGITSSATGFGYAGKGSLYIDSNDGLLYSMMGTGPAHVSWLQTGTGIYYEV